MGKAKGKSIIWLLAGCLITGAFFSCLRVSEVKAAVNFTDGLIGYWTFDGSLETEQLENQAAGTGVTMTKAGSGVILKTDGGISGGSVYFSKQDASYLKVNLKDADQGLNTADQDFSIAAWVKFESDIFQTGGKGNLFQQDGNGRTILYLDTTKKYGTYLTANDILCNQEVVLGEWCHIVFTSDHSEKKAQFYINGILASEQMLTGDFADAMTDILIGAHKNPVEDSAMKGSIDELRYYNKVIDAETAKALYDMFGGEAEKEALSERLRELIISTESLNGGDEEKKATVLQKAADAEKLLKDIGVSVDALEEQITLLQEAIDAYKKSIVVSIEVDAGTKVRDISDAMFGINHRYHNDGYSSWNAQRQEIEEKFNRLVKEASFGSVRYPGGTVANLYDWKRTIGSVEQRKKTIHGNTKEPITPNFGVDEAMKWIYDELDAQAVWVYAMGQGSAQDAADLFEYLNAPADGPLTNPNGGVDWAEVRAQNGRLEPYGVTRFEIGNEMGIWGQNYWMSGCGSASYDNMANAYVNGGDMTFTKERTVKEEDWRDTAAVSDGSAGLVRYARYKFVKEDSAHVYVNNEEWQIVDSLDGQGAANVCEFEYETGKITFGDGINGNIPAIGTVITATYTSKQDGFTAYYDALKKIAEELDMEVNVYSCMEKEAAITALKNAGNKYDGAVIHPYSETSGTGGGYINISEDDPQFYEKLLGRSLEHNMGRVSELVELMGEGKVPVVSEFGIYKHNTQFIRAIGHAVYIANEMIDYINFGTPYLNKHCLVDYPYGSDNLGAGAQCVIQALENEDGTMDFVSTPSAKAFSIFNHMTGNEQVGQIITGSETYYTYEQNGSYEVPTVKVISTKDEEENIYVTAVNNRKDDDTPVKIKVDGRDLSGEEIEIWYLTSDDVEDENTKENPNHVDIEKIKKVGGESVFSYSLAPHSVTSFKIPAKKIAEDPPKDDEEPPQDDKQPLMIGEQVTDAATNGIYQVSEVTVAEVSVVYTGMANKNLASCTVPNMVKLNGTYCKVTGVSENAFKNNKLLSNIVIGDNVKTIGANAFWGCAHLKTVTIGENVTEIGKKAFYKAASLKKIKIPASVNKIGISAFQGAKKLKTITILTKKLTQKTVGKKAFKGIYAKAKIKVPGSKLKIYKKLLKAKGVGVKAKIKK